MRFLGEIILATVLSGAAAPAEPPAGAAPPPPPPDPALAAHAVPAAPAACAADCPCRVRLELLASQVDRLEARAMIRTQSPVAAQTAAAPPAAAQVIWQLQCRADGKIYKHANKAYLERWVADKESLEARAQELQQPKVFWAPMPGYGYTAGAPMFGGAGGMSRCGPSGCR